MLSCASCMASLTSIRSRAQQVHVRFPSTDSQPTPPTRRRRRRSLRYRLRALFSAAVHRSHSDVRYSQRARSRCCATPRSLRYLSARLLATLAAQMQTVAVGWQVYAITRDPLDLGLIGLVAVPAVRRADPARRPNRRSLRSPRASSCCATRPRRCCALLLLVFTLHGVASAWPVFAAMMLLGCARAFSMPSGQALLPNLVPPESSRAPSRLNSSVFQIATVCGSCVRRARLSCRTHRRLRTVAVLAASRGLVDAASRVPAHAAKRTREPASLGIRCCRDCASCGRRPIVLGAISLDLFAVLFGGATALLPIFAQRRSARRSDGLGLVTDCARHRRALVRDVARAASDRTSCRRVDVRRRRRVRRRDASCSA